MTWPRRRLRTYGAKAHQVGSSAVTVLDLVEVRERARRARAGRGRGQARLRRRAVAPLPESGVRERPLLPEAALATSVDEPADIHPFRALVITVAHGAVGSLHGLGQQALAGDARVHV